MLTRRQYTAGRRADAIYREGLAAWRRKVTPLATLVMLPFMAAGVALGVYTDDAWRFFGGALFGVAFAVVLWVRDTPPQYLENWATGAEGERKTERALRKLAKSGWIVLHDLPGRRGNIDHVVVGPPGLFVLDSKAPSGALEVRGGRLVADRLGIDALRYTRDFGGRVAGTAHELWIDLGGRRAGIPRVRGVAVVWGKLSAATSNDRFALVPGTEIADWLAAHPATLTPDAVHRLAAAVETLAAERSA